MSIGLCRATGQALIIQGPPGSGKTATLEYLWRHADGPKVRIEPWPKMGYGSLVRAVLRALGVPPAVEFMDNLERLRVRLSALAETQGRPFLLVDNAELLTARQWRALWALFTLHADGVEVGPIPIVATRRERLNGDFHKYETLKLQQWREEDIREFVRLRCGEWPETLDLPRQGWAAEIVARYARWRVTEGRRKAAVAGGAS
jgi:type II secretory pathway predicted ATPase ExeA